ncbi:MAG: hypothetical protein H6617_09395 [Bdellovibrionaceae bacterium]|nr:hypothetical protein [Bdellovibrionales bacterium]MCB9254883.1 hypothetical protein [Pseudobdellovibrionaceae bacterium]
MPYYIFFLFLLAVGGPSVFAAGETPITLKHFRFGKHKSQDFERLVIQFGGNRPDPRVQISANPNQKEATVALENVHLIGAIPESAINDSYVGKSRYLGPISINTDDPNRATTLRVFLKENTLKFDAFWLQNPARLVVDAFPPTSPRSSKGRFILTAAKKAAQRNLASSTLVNKDVVCFPIASQLSPTVSFREQAATTPSGFVKNSLIGPIACYPVDAEVKATIFFAPASRVPQSTTVAPLQQKGYVAPKLLPPSPPGSGLSPTTQNAGPLPPGSTPPNGRPPGAPPRLPAGADLENTGGKGSRVNAGGFSPVTPLGSKLGAGGPVAPAADPAKLLPPGR